MTTDNDAIGPGSELPGPDGNKGSVFDRMEQLRSLHIYNARTEDLDYQVDRLLRNTRLRIDPNLPFGPGNRREARCLVVIGESGAGKSTAIVKALSRHPGFGEAGSDCPIVRILAPSPCTLNTLGREIAACLGYPFRGETRENAVWSFVRARLAERGVTTVVIDELQHLTGMANVVERTKVRNTLKRLLIDSYWPVALILSGLPEIEEVLDDDKQIRNRTRSIKLAQLRENRGDIAMMADIVGQLAGLVDLALEADAENVFVPWLLKVAGLSFGTTIEVALDAIEEALEDGAGTLAMAHLQRVRELKSGGSAAEGTSLLDGNTVDLLGERRTAATEPDGVVAKHVPAVGKPKRTKGRPKKADKDLRTLF